MFPVQIHSFPGVHFKDSQRDVFSFRLYYVCWWHFMTDELKEQRGEKIKKIMGINAIVVNLLKNIQPIRRMVIKKYVTEQMEVHF